MRNRQTRNYFTNLLWKLHNKMIAVKPRGLEVSVVEDNEGKPLRYLEYVICCPKCGETHVTNSLPYIICGCGFSAPINYEIEVPVIGLQDTINQLNVRINYMLATGKGMDEILPFIAELKELSDAKKFGVSESIKEQQWKERPLHEVLY